MLLIIAAEEAIAKGIRRVVALTGPEAVKALNKAKLLENELGKVTVVINESKLGQKVCTDLWCKLNYVDWLLGGGKPKIIQIDNPKASQMLGNKI